jgi:fatty-acyl-CoA synthase
MAAARVGAVLVNVNPAARLPELRHALAAARVQTLFLEPAFRDARYAEMAAELCPALREAEPDALRAPELPELRRVVVFDPAACAGTRRPARGFLTWPELLERGRTLPAGAVPERAAALDPDDPANIQFTSGTTGLPKPVVLTHHNLLNNAWFTGEVLGFGPRDRLCMPVPFYHCFGMVVSTLVCLTRGATLVIPAPHFDARATLAAIEAERCTALHGVPTMFIAELEELAARAYDLASLRTGIMAGAPCPPELVRRVMEQLGCRDILIGYGETEASPITHLTRPHDSFERRVGTVGTSLPYQEVKVVEPRTRALLPLGEVGEVCFRGWHVMRGYFGLEQATRATIDEAGWLHSGDLGALDADGYLRITGRLKEMIVRGGEKIYPAEVEAVLHEHPALAEVAVFGLPHPTWGEEVAAWIRSRPGASIAAEDLRAWARERLAHFKVPRHVWFVEEFPMTVTGKLQKFRMREISEGWLRSGPTGAGGEA